VGSGDPLMTYWARRRSDTGRFVVSLIGILLVEAAAILLLAVTR
jgi:hypothetical protein